MVNLTRIYTRTGDDGRTRLANNQVVAKTDPRLEAYGQVDEANCALGLVLADPGLDARIRPVLAAIQNDLFDVGADLATPLPAAGATGQPDRTVRVDQSWIDRLEGWCDDFQVGLEPLKSFVLPGGAESSARLNLARTAVRRAERAAWRAGEHAELNPATLTYLNRLSDLLFILGRQANRQAGVAEVLWQPAQAGR